MIVLLFSVGPDRYALPASLVVEVLPLVGLKQAPGLPPGVAGLLNYRGAVAPVVDLDAMLLGTPCPLLLSSRLLVTRHALPDGRERLLGLRVERVSGRSSVAAEDWVPSEVRTPPWLGRVMLREGAIVQIVHLDALLTPAVQEVLFPPDDAMPEASRHADLAAD
jgi:chemotaxis-related protein WspB